MRSYKVYNKSLLLTCYNNLRKKSLVLDKQYAAMHGSTITAWHLSWYCHWLELLDDQLLLVEVFESLLLHQEALSLQRILLLPQGVGHAHVQLRFCSLQECSHWILVLQLHTHTHTHPNMMLQIMCCSSFSRDVVLYKIKRISVRNIMLSLALVLTC